MNKDLQHAARTILNTLASGRQFNGIQSPPFNVPKTLRLLGTSYKVDKGRTKGIYTGILYMAPANSSGITRNGRELNVCPWFTKGCRAGCLGEHAGRMVYHTVGNSRLWKTALYAAAPNLMREMIVQELTRLTAKVAKTGDALAIRLDGTSDLGLSKLWKLPAAFPSISFYDYTKSVSRIRDYKDTDGVHYTFSASEAADSRQGAQMALDKGLSVAAIIPADTVPGAHALVKAVTGEDRPYVTVASGDETDLRFLDVPGTITWLGVKGGKRVEALLGEMVFTV